MGKFKVEGPRKCETKTRGRPKGKPVPLSSEERRVRNTILERQRRDEMTDAFTDLKESLELCNLEIKNESTRAQALNLAIEFLEKREESLMEIRYRNKLLREEITILEHSLNIKENQDG